jgi:tetratricopeptide (TPR) repeat protein
MHKACPLPFFWQVIVIFARLGFNVMMNQTRARQLLEAAIVSGGKRDYESAVATLLELLSEYDELPDAYLYLGRSYHSLGDSSKAIQAFRVYLDRGDKPAAGYFFLGRSYLALGLPRQAFYCLQKSLEYSPDSPQALGLLGYACLRLKKSSKALEILERAIRLAPADARLYRAYLNAVLVNGIRKLNQGQYDLAEQMLRFAIENGLQDIHARLYHAHALCGLSLWARALEEYDRCIIESPEDPAIRMRRAIVLAAAGRVDQANEEWRNLKKEIPNLPGESPAPDNMPVYTALTELERGEYRRAANAAVEGLRKDPKHPMLHALAAEAYRNLGSNEKAANHFRRALEQDKDNPDLRSALILVLWSMRDYAAVRRELSGLSRSGGDPGVIEYYSLLCQAKTQAPSIDMVPKLLKAIEKRGLDIELMETLADVAFKLGRPELSMPWYEKILEAEPHREEERLAYIACREALGPPEALEEAYLDYLELYPDNADIRREYADKLRGVGRWEDAAREYQALIPFEDSGGGLSRIIALCLRNCGKYREAAIIYRESALREPDRPENAKNLVYCLYKMGRKDQAISLMEAGCRHFSKDAEAVLILAWMYGKRGKGEKAVDAYRKAIEMNPASWQAHQGLADVYKKQGLHELEARYRGAAAALKGKAAKAGKKKP